ncbi:hypothetical protein BH23BAC1_BH23BAC1_29660 [soil metagenome]
MKIKPESYFPDIISNIKGFAFFLMDQEGIITSWNIGCEQMKGFTPEDAIGTHYEILFPDFLRDKKMPQKELDEAYKNGRYDTENWRIKKDGEMFWAYVVLTKVIDDDGAFIGYVKITQDHSEKKRFEDELNKKKEDLEKTIVELEETKEKIDKDLDGFVYMASHDLRSPISNMEGLLNVLVNHDCYKDKTARPLFDMLEKSVGKLKKTIRELSEISKIQASVQDDVQDIALTELIEEVTFSINDLISDSKATIEVDIASCPVIRFSTKNLRSIIYNLLSNAIKYCSPERKPEILIKTAKTDGYYVLIVKDNGLGIIREKQDKIFSMFRRFHDHVQGTGIGLYMVKRIVDNAAGKIEVESEPGKGSTFKIYLKS